MTSEVSSFIDDNKISKYNFTISFDFEYLKKQWTALTLHLLTKWRNHKVPPVCTFRDLLSRSHVCCHALIWVMVAPPLSKRLREASLVVAYRRRVRTSIKYKFSSNLQAFIEQLRC